MKKIILITISFLLVYLNSNNVAIGNYQIDKKFEEKTNIKIEKFLSKMINKKLSLKEKKENIKKIKSKIIDLKVKYKNNSEVLNKIGIIEEKLNLYGKHLSVVEDYRYEHLNFLGNFYIPSYLGKYKIEGKSFSESKFNGKLFINIRKGDKYIKDIFLKLGDVTYNTTELDISKDTPNKIILFFYDEGEKIERTIYVNSHHHSGFKKEQLISYGDVEDYDNALYGYGYVKNQYEILTKDNIDDLLKNDYPDFKIISKPLVGVLLTQYTIEIEDDAELIYEKIMEFNNKTDYSMSPRYHYGFYNIDPED